MKNLNICVAKTNAQDTWANSPNYNWISDHKEIRPILMWLKTI